MELPRNLLIIDDHRDAASAVARGLGAGDGGLGISLAHCMRTGIATATAVKPQVVILDLHLEPSKGVESGFETLRALLAEDRHRRVLVLTGHDGADCGVRALEAGAANFLSKPAALESLRVLVRDGFEQYRLRVHVPKPEGRMRVLAEGDVLVGSSPAMRKVREEVLFAAATTQPVLLLGETGTGKSLCAGMIHDLGPRTAHPFVRYRPGFGASDLAGAELFGHTRGAFTGATVARPGVLRNADRGTLFLDELDELPPELQVRLLGVLQDGRFRPAGEDGEVGVDVRFVGASNRPLREALDSGKLRRDLFHRIAHTTIHLPPLRDRRADIPGLARIMVERERAQNARVPELGAELLTLLERYDWPGNVRELQAVVQGAALRAAYEREPVIAPAHLRFPGSDVVESPPRAGSLDAQVREFKRCTVRATLDAHAGNQSEAARSLGIDRSTLRRILEAV